MKIALAQINMTVGDLRGNAAKILDAYQHSVQASATLVTTPEMAIVGYKRKQALPRRRVPMAQRYVER